MASQVRGTKGKEGSSSKCLKSLMCGDETVSSVLPPLLGAIKPLLPRLRLLSFPLGPVHSCALAGFCGSVVTCILCSAQGRTIPGDCARLSWGRIHP